MILWQEELTGLSYLESTQGLIKEVFNVSTVKTLEILFILNLVFQSLSKSLFLSKEILLKLNTLRNNVADHSLFLETAKFL